MDTSNMISELVKDLRPVKPIRAIGVRMALWVTISFAAIVGLLLAISARRDLEVMLRSGRLMVDAGMVALIAVTAGWGALRLSVPGEENVWAHKYFPVALLAFWFFFSIVQTAADAVRSGMDAIIPDPHAACAVLVGGAGMLLTVPLTFLIRGAAPLDPRWCGALAGLAASSAALVGIELICVYERPVHFAAYHVVPVTLFTVAGALLGPIFFPHNPKK